ncbi:MAG TPA: carbohydrate kinase family protein [Candidatus Egerieimonas intestinavium]|uniref:Carbohydrate kinase family protein n=1 Tax=Candidatus Egerieimonas intestinavium TaxID=2840777 RepID=A0A9D1JF46_9FIRM|nr:carbohydrate kinase family protein [Candidatus Egerieimonas intestinavium]
MGKTKKKAVVAGHICLDITPAFEGEKRSRLEEILSPGKLAEVGEANIHCGGAVSNTGLAMKALGAEVSLVGKIGDDDFGRVLRSQLDEYGCGKGLVVSQEDSTGYTIVLAIPGIDRIFLHNSGANNGFSGEDVPEAELENGALFHFGYPTVMRKLYENDGEELVRMYRAMKQRGIATSLDMAAVDPNSPAGKVDWKKVLSRVLPYVDFFVPSVEELCFMLDRERYEAWSKRTSGDVTEVLSLREDIRPLADQVMEMGAKVLLIKCGAPGIYYRTAHREILKGVGPRVELDADLWSSREGFEKSYRPRRIRSGTGAGDTTIAAFLTGMLEGMTLEQCLQLAAAAGASCVAEYDALSGIPSLEKLMEKIAGGWEKQELWKTEAYQL